MKRILISISLLCIIGSFNYSIYQKEHVLKNGETVYLEIYPIDPRSLMQGDYVSFRYSLVKSIKDKPKNNSGLIVITVDKNHVGHFARFYNDETLKDNEKLVPYYTRFGSMTIRPDSFFFQEGHSKFFEEASYAMFKFNGSKDLVLFGLANQKLKQVIVKK